MGAVGAKRPGLSREVARPAIFLKPRREGEAPRRSVLVRPGSKSPGYQRKGAGSEATRSFAPKRARPAIGLRAVATTPSERSERPRLRAPASVATDWGPKLAGVSETELGAAASRRPPGCRPPARAGACPAGRAPSGPATRRGRAARVAAAEHSDPAYAEPADRERRAERRGRHRSREGEPPGMLDRVSGYRQLRDDDRQRQPFARQQGRPQSGPEVTPSGASPVSGSTWPAALQTPGTPTPTDFPLVRRRLVGRCTRERASGGC